jgi:hypothetical protein
VPLRTYYYEDTAALLNGLRTFYDRVPIAPTDVEIQNACRD